MLLFPTVSSTSYSVLVAALRCDLSLSLELSILCAEHVNLHVHIYVFACVYVCVSTFTLYVCGARSKLMNPQFAHKQKQQQP